MVEYNFILSNTGRKVRSVGRADIYLDSLTPIFNFTSVDNYFNITTSSGTVLLTSFPTGLDIFNRNLGAVIDYNFFDESISIHRAVGFDSNLRRTALPISGSKLGGRL